MPSFFLVSFLKIFFKFAIKKQHCWIFIGAGRNEKYKLKRTIKNYIHVSVVQLTGKNSKLSTFKPVIQYLERRIPKFCSLAQISP